MGGDAAGGLARPLELTAFAEFSVVLGCVFFELDATTDIAEAPSSDLVTGPIDRKQFECGFLNEFFELLNNDQSIPMRIN